MKCLFFPWKCDVLFFWIWICDTTIIRYNVELSKGIPCTRQARTANFMVK